MCANVTSEKEESTSGSCWLEGEIERRNRDEGSRGVEKLKKNRRWRCLLEPLVENFSDGGFWMVVDRSTNSSLPRFTILGFTGHTHALCFSLSLSLSLFIVLHNFCCSFFAFSLSLSLSLSLFLSCSRLAAFYFYRQIRRKFIEHHFPRRFLQRKCNRAIKLCFSAARENSQPPKSRV